MKIFSGIDVGSTTGKALLIDDSGKILGFIIMKCTPWPDKTARICLEKVLEEASLSEEDICYTIGTGYGRVKIPFADENISEITCHAKGAKWICSTIKTVLDIGGQDCKVIALRDDGKVREFVMNDKCAAGTGRFLEGQARALDLGIEDLSDLSLKAEQPAKISSQCSVFAESEVISQLNDGNSIPNIVAGIHVAICSRLLSLLKRVGIREDVAVTGGCAKNNGLIKILKEKIGANVVQLSEDPQIIGALGAAVLAGEKWRAKENQSENLQPQKDAEIR